MTKDEYTKMIAEIAGEIFASNNHVKGMNLQLDPNLMRGTFGGTIVGAVALAQMIAECAQVTVE